MRGPVPGPGVYLHVPFCAHRCGYCDFNVLTGHDADLRARYTDALVERLARVSEAGPAAVGPPGAVGSAGPWPAFGSVFVGGGTPTQLEPHLLARVLTSVADHLPLADDVEVSVEANPEDVDAGMVAALVEAGVTRLSIGAQATVPRILEFLDRRHDPDAVPQAVEVARSGGIASINVDLIYGAPVEAPEDFAAALAAVVGAGVDHVSAYALILEPNTPYATRVRTGAAPAPDDDVAADRMAQADAALGRAGFDRYEVSNWARPGHACRHNLATWAGGDYLGIGAGAHGHWAGRRWWEKRPTHQWLRAVTGGEQPLGAEEILTEAQRRTERLVLGLRTADGVPRPSVEPIDEAAVARLVAGGLVTDDGTRLVLTPAGRPVADGVALELLEA